MKKILLMITLSQLGSACSTTKSFRSNIPKESIDEGDIEEEEEKRYYVPTEVKAVMSMHWICCQDLCKGRQPQSVLKELHTPYIVCKCFNGKIFRVTRVKGANKKK